jgi:hypothetical protein
MFIYYHDTLGSSVPRNLSGRSHRPMRADRFRNCPRFARIEDFT